MKSGWYQNRLKTKFPFLFLFIGLFSCQHDPIVQTSVPKNTLLEITPSCFSCPSQPICAVADDIVVNSSTTYIMCKPLPDGQGSFTTDQNNCIIWKPAVNANLTVKTCIIACSGKVCDTTFITIFPPLSSDTSSTCNPSVIYFEKDVLPILTANCAYSGCHNAASKKDGIILDNYNNVIKTGKIKSGNASGSKLYEVMVDKDPKDVMPPPPATSLSLAQLKVISDWINQGAKNEKCTETTNNCSITNMSYTNNIKPILSSCTSCHKSGNASGGVSLDTYQGVKSSISGGKLLGSISWANSFKTMPPGGSKMNDCNISKVKSWIDAGGLNN